MCAECVKSVNDIFPEVPEEEVGNFLMNCTAFPFGDSAMIKKQLEDLRTKTSDYKRCYLLVEEEMKTALRP
jgi:hypothetical protein